VKAREFVESRAPDWDRVRELAERAERNRFRGLDKRSLDELTLGYRRMISDLALAQARFPRSRLLSELERAVARLHNVVYRGRKARWPDVRRTFSREIPRTVRAHWRYLVAALALFFVPAFTAYGVGMLRPALARTLVPSEVLEAAESGKLHTDRVLTLAPPSWWSAKIATNNIAVVFAAFALGIVLGLPTVFLLILNGVMIGMVLAVYDQYGLAGRLWTFLIGHGVTEISAICLAGAAGLLLGDAVVAPGWRSRRDAMSENGRDAVRIVTGLIPTLTVAGLVEGFISPSPIYPAPLKWVIGFGLGTALWLWLLVGGSDLDVDLTGSAIGGLEGREPSRSRRSIAM